MLPDKAILQAMDISEKLKSQLRDCSCFMSMRGRVGAGGIWWTVVKKLRDPFLTCQFFSQDPFCRSFFWDDPPPPHHTHIWLAGVKTNVFVIVNSNFTLFVVLLRVTKELAI